jgi:hypothetical protein
MGRRADAGRTHDAAGRDGVAPRGDAVPAVGERTRRTPEGAGPSRDRRYPAARGWAGASDARGTGFDDVRLQRAAAGAADRGGTRRGDHGRVHQSPAAAHHGTLARPPAGQPERRRARAHPTGGAARRRVHLPAALPRCRHLLVPPARARGHPAGAGTIRQPARAVDRWRRVRSGQPRGGADARRPPDRRGRAGAARAGHADPRAHGPLRQPAGGER